MGTHLWPMQPLKVGRLQGLGQAEAVVDGHQLQLAGVQHLQAAEAGAALALAAHQDVARVAVGVPDADVQDADAVHVARTEAGRAHLAGVAVVVHVLLRQRGSPQTQPLALARLTQRTQVHIAADLDLADKFCLLTSLKEDFQRLSRVMKDG